MKYRKLDNDGDYVLGNPKGIFYEGTSAVGQAIKTNLLFFLGEWWEDTSKGLPLFQNILGQPGAPENQRAIDLLIQATIMGTTGVVSIKNFTSSYKNRSYSVASCTVETQYGDIILEEVVF